jgi:hypothetical protein
MSRELYIFKQRISQHSGTKMQCMSALVYVRLNCILTYCYAPRYKVWPHLNPFSRTGLNFECSSASLHAFRLRIWNVTDPILRQSKVPILCFGTVTISYKVELLVSAPGSLTKCNWIISISNLYCDHLLPHHLKSVRQICHIQIIIHNCAVH